VGSDVSVVGAGRRLALTGVAVAAPRVADDHAGMIAAFSITPLGVSDSVGASVADAVRLVRASGLDHETNAMFTNVEGDWDEVMALIKSCVMTVAESAPRVSVVIKIDHRPGRTGALRSKVVALEAHLEADRTAGTTDTADPRTNRS
jgi:uncharacterized protein (TIGR00106 family)